MPLFSHLTAVMPSEFFFFGPYIFPSLYWTMMMMTKSGRTYQSPHPYPSS